MRRFALRSLLLSCVLLPLASEVMAAGKPSTARSSGPIFQRRQAPRLQRESYAEYLVVPHRGETMVRQVYNGYVNGFPRPAYLYYGAPHSGDDTGIGAMDRR